MGFVYLKGNRWSQVTRDERFFCQHLMELVNSEPIENFVQYLSDKLQLGLTFGGEWELGFEVCFYRDYWQFFGRDGKLYSPKRTFDLCLFGESSIVVIEAKAAGGFDPDQNEVFKRDLVEIKRLTGVPDVQLIGLCSSQYEPDASAQSTFGSKVIRWSDLSARFGNDEILSRADEIYEESEPFSKRGRHSDIKLAGSELIKAFAGGAEWWVGRGGGLGGDRFIEDVQTERWKSQIYEVCTKKHCPSSPNYFSLAEFAEAVNGG